MEKKKLLLVAISVGFFLVLTIGAAILVFTPKNTNNPLETAVSISDPETISVAPPPSYQAPDASTVQGNNQPSSIDGVEMVRTPGGVPGLVTTPEGAGSQSPTGTGTIITITPPTTAAVSDTPPAGRAAPPTTPSPSQTASTPAQTTTTPQTASTPAQTTTTPQTASTPAQTTTPQTASTPTTRPVQTASIPAQTTPVQATPAAASQPGPAAQTRINDDFWVQTGAFSTIASAEGVKETLSSRGITSVIENRNIDGRNLFRVRVGPYTSQNEANYWLALIQSMDGFEDSQVRQTPSLR